MSGVDGFNDKVAFIWSVADLLRGDVKSHEYGQFILPFVVLRRLDCVLEPTKQQVLDKAASLAGKVGNVDPILERVSGAPFYNTSPLTFQTLLNDPGNIKANLFSYVAGFSSGAAEVLEKYWFPERIATLERRACCIRWSRSSRILTCTRRWCRTTRWVTSSKSCCGGSRRCRTRPRASISHRVK
jgi:hypothetical protein